MMASGTGILRLFIDHNSQENKHGDRVTNELIRLVFQSGYASNITVLLLAVALTVMVRPVIAPPVLQGWLAGMTALFFVKCAAIFCYRRKEKNSDPTPLTCVQLYIFMVFLTGVLWGLGVILFFKPDAVMEQMAVIFIVAGLTAGAIPILSPLRKLYSAYIACPLFSLLSMLVQHDGQYYAIMASVIVLYILMLIKSASHMQHSLVTSLEMRFSNEELAEHLKQARDAAQAGSRAKDEFLANMSHEIRTPMNGILGTLQLLRETELNATQAEYARLGCSSAEALLAILNDILDFSKIEARKLSLERIPFSPRVLVDDLLHLLGHPAEEKGIVLAAEVDERLPPMLLGDPTRLRQVLANLMTNALKFTEQGEVRVVIRCLVPGDAEARLRIEVRDTGIGIAPEARQHLFQVFSQADGSTTRRYGGTGLGLAIARQLVVMMDGEIGVESESGKGSTFWCEIPFPVAEAVAEQAQPLQATAAPQALSGSILLVEDNKVNQVVARKMLTGMGISVTVAENGEQALVALEQAAYDVVLMDCQMPVLDGYEATRRLRARERGTARQPIIAMTANAMEGDRRKCLDAGMDDHLAKPVQKEALRAMLAKWLDRGGEA